MRNHGTDNAGGPVGARDTGVLSTAATELPVAWEIDHGEHCGCLLLAAACGAGPEAIQFSYCRNVLQKHWRTICEHGGRSPAPPASERWRGFGKIDPIRAVLIREG